MWAELEAEQQTPLVDIRRSPRQFKIPPPLPAMDEPAVYILHPDVMQVNTRKNYVRDRMRAALIYISEYMETKRMMTEKRYNNEELLVRLRAVFGRVDQVRDHIDRALQQDDAHRRKRDMRFLLLPTRFPRPESMEQGDIAIWTYWICEKTEEIMKQLEEERDSRSDPDDPVQWYCEWCFSTLARSIIIALLQYRHQNNTRTGSENREPSQNLREDVRGQSTAKREERTNKAVTPMQGEPHEFREHSRQLPDPMASIRNLHIQQRQNRRSVQDSNQSPSPAPQTPQIQVSQQEANLITFTPIGEQQVPQMQGAAGSQEQPKRQRSPRRKRSLNGLSTRDNLIKTKHRKFHTFHLENI